MNSAVGDESLLVLINAMEILKTVEDGERACVSDNLSLFLSEQRLVNSRCRVQYMLYFCCCILGGRVDDFAERGNKI